MLELFGHLNSLHPLSAETVAALLRYMQRKELRRNQVWLQQGAVCDKLAFVERGMCKTYFEEGSKELVLGYTTKNDVLIAADSYFGSKPSTLTIRALEGTILVYVPVAEMNGLMKRFSDLNVLMRVIAEREAMQLEKHLELLMLPARMRYERVGEMYSWLLKKCTDRMIAAFIWVTPNCISYYRNGRWEERRRGQK